MADSEAPTVEVPPTKPVRRFGGGDSGFKEKEKDSSAAPSTAPAAAAAPPVRRFGGGDSGFKEPSATTSAAPPTQRFGGGDSGFIAMPTSLISSEAPDAAKSKKPVRRFGGGDSGHPERSRRSNNYYGGGSGGGGYGDGGRSYAHSNQFDASSSAPVPSGEPSEKPKRRFGGGDSGFEEKKSSANGGGGRRFGGGDSGFPEHNRSNNASSYHGGGFHEDVQPSPTMESGDDHHQHRAGRQQQPTSLKPKSVRYSELDAEGKAKVRLEERTQKKERDRKIRYFIALETSLKSVISTSKEAGEDVDRALIGSMLDGLYTELSKVLKKPEDRQILTIGNVCRALETAVSLSSLHHLETLLYSMLGNYKELLMVKTASYFIETVFAAVYTVLSHTDANEDDAQGTVDGMPNVWELAKLVAEELSESLLELMVDVSGSRALSSLLKVFSGIPIRGAPEAVDKDVSLKEPLMILVNGIVKCVEENGGWGACATTTGSSVVVQALVQCASRIEAIATLIRKPLSSMLPKLAGDAMGVFTLEKFLAVSCTWAEEDASEDEKCWWHPAYRILRTRLPPLLEAAVSSEEDAVVDASSASFLLASLISHAPTPFAFDQVYNDIITPSLKTLMANPPLFPGLLRVIQKCSSVARAAEVAEAKRAGEKIKSKETIAIPVVIPAEVKKSIVVTFCNAAKEHTKKGIAQYLLVDSRPATSPQQDPPSLDRPPLADEGDVAEGEGADPSATSKAPATNVGPELLTELLKLGKASASQVIHSFDKITAADIIAAAKDPQGTHVLQQFIVALAEEEAELFNKHYSKTKQVSPAAAAESTDNKKKAENKSPQDLKGAARRIGEKRSRHQSQDAQPAPKAAPPTQQQLQQLNTNGPLMRMFRRFEPYLDVMVNHRYASFVIQQLFDYGTLAVREAIAGGLKKHFQKLKSEFIASKVMAKIGVEQYMFRREDWLKMAERQAMVKRMMRQILTADYAAAPTPTEADATTEAAADTKTTESKAQRGKKNAQGGGKKNKNQDRGAPGPKVKASEAEGDDTRGGKKQRVEETKPTPDVPSAE